jgi:DNA-3-methyladenine glycosylase
VKKPLSQHFFNLPTLEAAKKLLGCVLTTCVGKQKVSGMIVEVEAYRGDIDPAAHCYGGRTQRNAVMFGPPGHIYVYFIYGLHYCVNVVTEKEGIGAAVLIRALEPRAGLEAMQQRRGCKNMKQLTNGPAKICEALAIDNKMLGADVRRSKIITLERHKTFKASEISASPRIGISKATELKWRFYVKGNVWVSKS